MQIQEKESVICITMTCGNKQSKVILHNKNFK